VATLCADQQVARGGPAFAALAARADETFGPAQLEEKLAAGLLGSEAALEPFEGFGIFFTRA
jgi:hypothetical protein